MRINIGKRNKIQVLIMVLVAVIALSIGYASITALNLLVNGNAIAGVNENNFKVYFIQVGDTPKIESNVTVTGSARINTNDNTKAEFDVSGLTKVGDYAIATYTVLNDSTAVGTRISLRLSNSNQEFFKVTETINDKELQAGDSTTATIKVEMIKTPINNDVSTSVTGTLTASPIENAEATGNNSSVLTKKGAFETDSWSTIQTNVRNNDTDDYNLGDTKTVTINGTDYTVKLVNKSTESYCSDPNYSQTACGFVVEFQDIIAHVDMTGSMSGGYPASSAYAYLNNTLYNSLPTDLKSSIANTRVVSGHESSSSTETYISENQKLYILSAPELMEYTYGGDTSNSLTKELDYYIENPSTYNEVDFLGKKYNGLYEYYLSRTIINGYSRMYAYVGEYGYIYGGKYGEFNSSNAGLAPAFRIG